MMSVFKDLMMALRNVSATLTTSVLPYVFQGNTDENLENYTMTGMSEQGKNVFDYREVLISEPIYLGEQGRAKWQTGNGSFQMEVEPDTTYTIKCNYTGNITLFRFATFSRKITSSDTTSTAVNNSSIYSSTTGGMTDAHTFTTTSTDHYLICQVNFASYSSIIQTIQVVKGASLVPTRVSPIEINSVGDRVDIDAFADTTGITEQRLIGIDGAITTNTNYNVTNAVFTPKGEYAYNITDASGINATFRVSLFDADGTFLSTALTVIGKNQTMTGTITVEQDCYTRISYRRSSTNIYVKSTFYKIPVSVKSKNLFDKSIAPNAYSYYPTSDGVIGTSSIRNATQVIRHIQGATYYMKHTNGAGGGRMFYTTEETFGVGTACSASVGSATAQQNVVTSITPPDDAKWVFFIYGRYDNDSSRSFDEQASDCIITKEVIDSTTPYSEYLNCEKDIYITEPLRQTGDFADYIDYKNQQIVRNVKKVKLNPDWAWVTTSTIGKIASPSMPSLNNSTNADKNTTCMCEYWKGARTNIGLSAQPDNTIKVGFGSGNYKNIIYLADASLDGDTKEEKLASFIQFITDNDVYVYYALVTPLVESFTFPDLAITNAELTLDVDTEVKPSEMSITGDIQEM